MAINLPRHPLLFSGGRCEVASRTYRDVVISIDDAATGQAAVLCSLTAAEIQDIALQVMA